MGIAKREPPCVLFVTRLSDLEMDVCVFWKDKNFTVRLCGPSLKPALVFDVSGFKDVRGSERKVIADAAAASILPEEPIEGQIASSEIHPASLRQMRKIGGRWAAYRNENMGIKTQNPSLGHLRFLKFGEGCTFDVPPKRYPDTASGAGWAYGLVGNVVLETGEIETVEMIRARAQRIVDESIGAAQVKQFEWDRKG